MNHLRGAALALALAFGATAQAADDVRPLLPLSLEELIATPVVTASRHQEGREQTPAHIVVITREQMRDRRYKNLADLLEDLPGVDFQRATRSSQYNNFAFQGHISNNKLLILLDGVRIDQPAGDKIPIAENFSLYFAKQVEVLYGPAAALYGADALAGVINIITEQASSAGGKVAAGTGSYGSLEGNFLVGAPLGAGFSLTAGAHYQQSDRAPLDKYYPDAYPKVAAGGLSASQRENYVGDISSHSQYFRLDYENRLTIGFYRNNFRNLSSNGDKTVTSYYLSNAFLDTTIDTWYGKYRFDITPELSGETVVDYSTYQLSPQSRYINVFTGFTNIGYDYAMARRHSIEQNLNWRASEQHLLQGGIGYRDYKAIETPDLPHPYDTNQGPQAQGMLYPNTNLPLRIFDSNYYSGFGYLQWQAQWAPTFSTTLGLRDDWYSTYGNRLNPRLGAVWKIAPGNYLKLLYGEAFRAPSPEESFSSFGSFPGTRDSNGNYTATARFRAPNANLAPEKSKTWSLTWDWRPRNNLNLVTNAYYTEVSDVVVTLNDPTPIQYIPGAVLAKTSSKQNAGQDKYYGVDIIPQWQLHLGGPWMADIWGSYSHIQGTTRNPVDQVDWAQSNIAAHKFKLGVTLRYQDWLTITPRLQWIGETTTGMPDTTKAPGERLKTDAYTVASLHLGAHKLAGERLSLYVDVYNLFDARYYAAHGSSSDTLLQVPQQPRTFMGTVEYRF